MDRTSITRERRLAGHVALAALIAIPVARAASCPAPVPTLIQEEDVPEAGRLLDAAQAKVGDTEARAGLVSLVGRGVFKTPGGIEGRFEEIHVGDKARWSTEFPGYGSSSQGTDGEMTWSTDPAMGVMVLHGEDQGSARRLYLIGGRSTSWRDMYVAAQVMGEVDLDGRPHYKVALKPPKGESETWYVDVESGLLTRVDLPLPDFQGGQLHATFEFSDWESVDGLLLPHTKVQKVGGYVVTFTYEELTVNTEVTPEQIAPSETVLAAAADGGTTTPAPSDDPTACAVETIPERPTLTIRKTIEVADVGSALAVLLPEVMGHISREGVAPAGPPFSRYHTFGGDTIDMEAGMPVSDAVEGAGRVEASRLPAGKVAVTWHIGDFHGLKSSYDRLEAWMSENDLVARGGPWEVYWTDPGLEPDPAKWRTQILWPVE